ncbi:MAG: PQQ-binding-like beta-propeller repeat protein [Chloroflexota bacterium]
MESNQLFKEKRPFRRSYIIFFLIILTPVLLGACGANGQNTSWPGLTAEENTVYLAYGPGVLAFDIDEQTQKWVYPAEANATLQFFAAPDVENGRLVFGDYGAAGGFLNPSPTISIYGVEDSGETVTELWTRNDLASDRIAAQPLIAGDTVYVGTSDNLLLALDLNSGDELWRFETEHSVWTQPTLLDDTLFVSSLDRHIYALDAETGEEKWTELLTGALSGKPIVADGLVILSNFDTKLHALDVETGVEQWSADSTDWVWSAPTVSDGQVYFGDASGAVYAVSLATGEQIWQVQTPGAIQTSPVVANGLVFIASAGPEETETGILQALSVEDGAIVWDATTTSPIFTTPVVVDDTLVVAVNSNSELLVGYGLESGTRRWAFLPES